MYHGLKKSADIKVFKDWQYFTDNEEYAKRYADKKLYVDSDNGNCWWWLRSPGGNRINAVGVGGIGSIVYYGRDVSADENAVRPALWINLGS